MAVTAILVSTALFGVAVVTVLATVPFLRWLATANVPQLADDDCPPAAILMSLRGSDPFLAETVRRLIQQDYPNFTVYIVVDSEDDTAWPVVQEVVAETGVRNVQVDVLTERRRTCSLKISGVLQAFGGIDPDCEIVAFVDADALPPPNWLRHLAAPLVHGIGGREADTIGATSGNRWYLPVDRKLGSLVRHLWNAGAVVQMHFYRIAWGGSFALRAETLRSRDLFDRVSNAFGEDQVICRFLTENGRRVEHVPSLFLVNRESCDLSGLFRFVQRQLLSVRTHHKGWWLVALQGVTPPLLTWSAVGVAIALGCLGQYGWASLVASSLALFYLVLAVALWRIERLMMKRLQENEAADEWLSVPRFVRLLVTIPITDIFYAITVLSMPFTHTHLWRGARYRFAKSPSVELIHDDPRRFRQPAAESLASIE